MQVVATLRSVPAPTARTIGNTARLDDYLRRRTPLGSSGERDRSAVRPTDRHNPGSASDGEFCSRHLGAPPAAARQRRRGCLDVSRRPAASDDGDGSPCFRSGERRTVRPSLASLTRAFGVPFRRPRVRKHNPVNDSAHIILCPVLRRARSGVRRRARGETGRSAAVITTGRAATAFAHPRTTATIDRRYERWRSGGMANAPPLPPSASAVALAGA